MWVAQVLKYFASLGLNIMEVFGMSECSGPHSANYSHTWKLGSIGREVSTACGRYIHIVNNEPISYSIIMGIDHPLHVISWLAT